MCIPLFLAIGYQEATNTIYAFLIAIVITVLFGIVGICFRPKNANDRKMNSTSGFVVCGIAWIFICLIGAIPYRVSGYIPNYISALFETVSGFSTTGSSLVDDIEAFPKSLLFWRSFTQWMGGMGVLVFVIALLPKNDKMSTALAKAEIPGPQFGKLVGKLRTTTRILYAFYIVLTLLLAGILCALKMPAFDSFCHAFTTASTGGFSIKNGSIASYYYLENIVGIEITLTIFMIIFSINFNIFFMILISKIWKAIKNEELFAMLAIMFVSVVIITAILTIRNTYSSIAESLRYSTFQVASVMSTTGFDNTPIGTDYTQWPVFTQAILATLMLIGGSAGSTSGGIKVSRLLIITKSSFLQIRKTISPRSVGAVKFNGKALQQEFVDNIITFSVFYVFSIIISTILLSINSPYPGANGFLTNFSAVLTCISNVGPGFGFVGPDSNFSDYNEWQKIVMCVDMLIGRLEVFPIILLFYPKSWKPYNAISIRTFKKTTLNKKQKQ